MELFDELLGCVPKVAFGGVQGGLGSANCAVVKRSRRSKYDRKEMFVSRVMKTIGFR